LYASPSAQLLFITQDPPFVRGLSVSYGSIDFYLDPPCLQRARQTSTGFYLVGIKKKSSDGLKKVDITLLYPTKAQFLLFLANIIAAMDTGSGKTLISLLLIKWMTAQEQSKGKLVIFLVPQVALVEQQGKVLSKYTNLRVLKLHGSLELDLSDRSGWQKRFETNDVLIMTGIWTFFCCQFHKI
jgi:CRISPR/Cas system-associated endonuclease/helicase Cas3